jgi:hypothetical protein
MLTRLSLSIALVAVMDWFGLIQAIPPAYPETLIGPSPKSAITAGLLEKPLLPTLSRSRLQTAQVVPPQQESPRTTSEPAPSEVPGVPAPKKRPVPSATGSPTPRSVVTAPIPTGLEDLLLERGIITMDDWIRLQASEEQKAVAEATELQMTGSPRWFERIKILGYVQSRYAVGATSHLFDIPLGDRLATSDPREFYIRRIRVVLAGEISERLSFYLQPAFEGDQQNLFNKEMVDAFADYHITRDRQWRLRFGLHRVPNSFDTYRSSSQRIELDRHESIQSGAPGERDLGVALYWTSKIAQLRYAQMAIYHNGPGDYGNIGLMVYNGQTRNKVEANADKHVGIHLAHPFELPNGRLVQLGAMAFRGQYVVSGTGPIGSSAVSWCPPGLRRGSSGCEVDDERVTAYIYTPTQPLGLIAEYTAGRGPLRNSQGIIEEKPVHGGYAELMYTWRYSDVGLLTPYVRYGVYHGGLKSINGANGRSETVNVGLVWEPDTHWRFVTEWMWKDGLNASILKPGQDQLAFEGSILRFQVQWFFN